ncbi:TetR/AcrR family transcriptional regulator C-terminal ligand-binding domain-containing protein [Nocardioides sp. CPCC 205120]|uniref:TetR/AcrR family transcriptional regulator n=1 Tax=Nocardioides sp. CPCC 205120 TaxID=3406462 RepID=UPI003B503C9A
MARPRDPDLDRRVVDACVALLGEQGRQGLSRAQVARRARVSLPAVNRRFASVDEILVAVASQPGGAGLSEGLDEPTSLRSFLVHRLLRLARAGRDPSLRRATGELLAAAAGDPAVDAAFRATLAELRRDGLAWVDHARRHGEVDAAADGELLLDLVLGSTYYRLLWRGEALPPADVETVVDRVLAGFAPRRS